MNIVDVYDYYSLEDHDLLKHFNQKGVDKFEIQFEDACESALCRTFRFFQLFGENNNIKMKEFLTNQINNESENFSKKINSINFIQEACLILRNLFKIMNSRTVSIPKYILGFIGEICQVPCISNQKSFIKETYFEDISYMSQHLSLEKNINLRKLDSDEAAEQLFEIYEESIKIALSNFEGRDEVIISDFLNKCHARFLWMCIKNNLYDLVSEKYPEYLVEEENFFEEQQKKLAVLKKLNP